MYTTLVRSVVIGGLLLIGVHTMPSILDIFNDDAFSTISLTAALTKVDHVPGQAGALTFAGTGEGVPTTDIAIEQKDMALSLIQTSARGAPAPQDSREKASMFSLSIPQIKLEQTIQASAVQNVRAFGANQLAQVMSIVTEQTNKMLQRIDLTLEYHRVGALKGQIRDADGTLLTDLWSAFGVSEPATVSFTASGGDLRTECQQAVRTIFRNVKLPLPPTAQVVGLCGDEFFDSLISHNDVKTVYQNWQAAGQRLGGDYTAQGFDFGGILFMWYRGTDGETPDASSALVSGGGEVGINSTDCRLFLTGVPGLYREYYAPADFLDTVNNVGLPRYSRLAVDPEMSRYAKIHVQANPLPLCTRPATLTKAVFA